MYQPSLYESLGTLHEADEALTAGKRETLLNVELPILFWRHRLQTKLGVRLLHRHFDLEPHERLVSYLKASTPWSELNCVERVWEVSWKLDHDGNPSPIEYAYDETKTGSLVLPKDFIQEFRDLLERHSASDVLGLQELLPDQDGVEITMGRANITLPMNQNTPNSVEALWTFPDPTNTLTRKVCRLFCVPETNHWMRHTPVWPARGKAGEMAISTDRL